MWKRPVSGEVRTHATFKATFTVVYGCNHNSDIKDHGSQVTITNIIIMKNFEIL